MANKSITMERCYVLQDKIPVLEPDLRKWVQWLETEDRSVDRTLISGCEVSTLFLGLDHQWGEGPPLLFETMIIGDDDRRYQTRCSTWEQAEVQHEEACTTLITADADCGDQVRD